MKILKNKAIIALVMSTILTSVFTTDYAKAARNMNTETVSKTGYNYDVELKDFLDQREKALHPTSVTSLVDGRLVAFEYDLNGNRTQEVAGDNVVKYYYDSLSNLSSVSYGEKLVTFNYDTTSRLCTSILYDNCYYTLAYDTAGNVTGLKNDKNELVAQYTYEDNLCTVLGKNELGEWIDLSDNEEFIGNINPFRLNANYYDNITGYYMIDGCCYNEELDEYLMVGIASRETPDVSNYISAVNEDSNDSLSLTSTASVDYSNTIIMMYQSYMLDPTFGNSISYSSNWYSSESSIELLARLLYGECMVTDDIPAVTWEVCNRMAANWSGFYGSGKSNTLLNVMTKSSAYSAITSISSSNTAAARQPSLTSARWNKAVWCACSLVVAKTRSALPSYVSKPSGIDKQCYHVGMVFYSKFSGTTASTLAYNGKNVKSVVLCGINSNVTSNNTLISYYNNYYNRNIFFTYSSEYGTNYSFN